MMMDIYQDDRVVLTLDAGGTNFVFSAMQKGKVITKEIHKRANAHDLDLCIATLAAGFREVRSEITQEPVAVSFAFPGPADYPKGVIGDLPNLTGFRGGVPLKSILEELLQLPVFINNDGNLFAYGEALGGLLPEINQSFAASGSSKRYHNLVGLTLGTGFGGGFVSNQQLLLGDNALAGEVHLFSNRYFTEANIEEIISTRSIQRRYAQYADLAPDYTLMPKDISAIATGAQRGDREAAIHTFQETGIAIGDIAANLFTFTDGIIVIGGGITGARDLYMPFVMEELKKHFRTEKNNLLHRLVQQVYNLDEEEDSRQFYRDYSKSIPVPGTNKTVTYDPVPRLGIGTSRIGASKAIALGAYAFALQHS